MGAHMFTNGWESTHLWVCHCLHSRWRAVVLHKWLLPAVRTSLILPSCAPLELPNHTTNHVSGILVLKWVNWREQDARKEGDVEPRPTCLAISARSDNHVFNKVANEHEVKTLSGFGIMMITMKMWIARLCWFWVGALHGGCELRIHNRTTK